MSKNALLAVACLPLLAIGVAAAADFKSSRVKAAKERYERGVKIAKEDYDKKVAAAAKKLITELQSAAKTAGRQGDVNEAKKLQDAVEELKNR